MSEDRSGPCEVSLDHTVNNVAAVRRHHLKEPSRPGRSGWCRSHQRCLAPAERGHRLPRSRAGRHSNRPSRRFTSRSNLRLGLRPLRTPRHRDALGISYRTSTTKARGGLPPPCCPALPGVPRRSPRVWDRGLRSNYSGGDLLSQGISPQVPSALVGLTSVFGMGTGVTPPLWPPRPVSSL